MSTEELEAAYLDAMKKLYGSVCGPQVATQIELYVERLQYENAGLKGENRGMREDFEHLERNLKYQQTGILDEGQDG